MTPEYFASEEGCWITEPGEPETGPIQSESYRKHLEKVRQEWLQSRDLPSPPEIWITEPGEDDPEAGKSESYRKHLEKVRQEWLRSRSQDAPPAPPPT